MPVASGGGMRGGNSGEGGSMVAGRDGRARLVAASGMPAARSAALVAVWRDRRVAVRGRGNMPQFGLD
jgi:hypothetical protein